ncbi:MAG: DUF1553 domain-containing protein, partial [Planctomycetaceae bacterium]
HGGLGDRPMPRSLIADFDFQSDSPRRSVYLPVFRNARPEGLAVFDAADPSLITADRPQTTVPSQALYLLNNPFVQLQADTTADRLLGAGETEARVQAAFQQFYGRPASLGEVAEARQFLETYTSRLAEGPGSRRNPERAAWSAFCQVLFASAEFQYRP